jgi:hypothetical protein
MQAESSPKDLLPGAAPAGTSLKPSQNFAQVVVSMEIAQVGRGGYRENRLVKRAVLC